MYRYSVDNSVTYSSADIILYLESPFASWMERFTLENPDHGIAPDEGAGEDLDEAPGNSLEMSDGRLVESVDWDKLVHIRHNSPGAESSPGGRISGPFAGEGKSVVLIDRAEDEFQRRIETQAAMKNGADLIVNAHLASGPLADTADLLMKASGFSELGNYLYVPCDTGLKTTPHSAFRLCFIADLLHHTQGQLPSQMLIIRGDSDIVALPTEDHIYYYRAVKQRFMKAQRSFRKHRMPDPAESSHFGRWSTCAKEILRQRALSGEAAPETEGRDGFEQAEDAGSDLAEAGLMPVAEPVAASAPALAPEPDPPLAPAPPVPSQTLDTAQQSAAPSAPAGLSPAEPLVSSPYDLDHIIDVKPGRATGASAPPPTIGLAPSSRYSLIDHDADVPGRPRQGSDPVSPVLKTSGGYDP